MSHFRIASLVLMMCGCPVGAFCAGELCVETVEDGRVTGVGITGGWCFVVD